MTPIDSLTLQNGETTYLGRIPQVGIAEFRKAVVSAVHQGARLSALFGQSLGEGSIRLYAVLSRGTTGTLSILSTTVRDSYLALTPECPQAHLFEREIAEQWGLLPEGHPWLKPVRFTGPGRAGGAVDQPGKQSLPGVMNFFQVAGEEIHEVAVGPIHAGVIEPGHFRFQCLGEEVLHLEIALGYQHRGVERALQGGPNKRTIHYMETLAGDTSIGHATAYAQAVEALAGGAIPARAETLRAIALELERIANHTGDLGALAGDIGFLPTAAYCGRLRGDFLNMTAQFCGSRFGRGFIRPGGVVFDLEKERAAQLLAQLEHAQRDVTDAVNLLWSTPSVLARLEGVGGVSRLLAEQLGLVGPAARACGLDRDVRFEFPSGFFRFAQIPVSTWHTGDVFSRTYLRWLEIQRSLTFVRERIKALPEGPIRAQVGPLRPDQAIVTLVEGWRGEICHMALTDSQGSFAHYKVVDPSFHNWQGLAMAMRGGQISDFPLINKSFNLSYAGHDL